MEINVFDNTIQLKKTRGMTLDITTHFPKTEKYSTINVHVHKLMLDVNIGYTYYHYI